MLSHYVANPVGGTAHGLGGDRVWLVNGHPGAVTAAAATSPEAASLPDGPPGDPVARGSSPSSLAPFTVDLGDVPWDAWPLTRQQVWLVPAVAQALQVIAGTIGTLPWARRRGRDPLDLGTLLAQPDPEEPREATVTALVEDLVLYPEGYLVVIQRDADGFPLHVRYVAHELVEPLDPPFDPYALVPPPRRYRIGVYGGVEVDASAVLRFPSHWPGLLTVGARTLRTSMLLELAAQRYASTDLPSGTLKNKGADLPPAKVDELLSTWERARRTHSVAYTNALIDFNVEQWDPTQLQLVDARRWQAAEVARLCNLPSRYLNAPSDSGSMTYSNVESERRDLVDLSLRPYLAAVERRLSMDDTCPHGQAVAFDLDAFYRGDLAGRGAYYNLALNGANPWLQVDEVRAVEGKPIMRGVDDVATTPTPA